MFNTGMEYDSQVSFPADALNSLMGTKRGFCEGIGREGRFVKPCASPSQLLQEEQSSVDSTGHCAYLSIFWKVLQGTKVQIGWSSVVQGYQHMVSFVYIPERFKIYLAVYNIDPMPGLWQCNSRWVLAKAALSHLFSDQSWGWCRPGEDPGFRF